MITHADGLRVLIVEDNQDSARTQQRLMQAYGHTVFLAADGLTAVELARSEKPDVVLLDIGLPGMDGWEVARHLHRQRGEKRPLLVAITGYGQPDDYHRSQEAGIDLHLTKPADPACVRDLLHRFQDILRNRERDFQSGP